MKRKRKWESVADYDQNISGGQKETCRRIKLGQKKPGPKTAWWQALAFPLKPHSTSGIRGRDENQGIFKRLCEQLHIQSPVCSSPTYTCRS